ncbi:hypothetical protein F8M41_018521 [Gigaspora margarita]|uniref:Uncharacterized protein n=1 Tax=Gigaspora margarita TaxID=4874 RepID=A0A8H4ALM8_GIGMA|nr:hypothetical protein F8M41_018521 [Gigaspora margarita]
MCGRKGDGYVRAFGPRPVEWAASECGPKWEGENRTKIIRERGLVLPKVLKDILVDLARKVNFAMTKSVELKFLDLYIQVSRNFAYDGGYLCRGEKAGLASSERKNRDRQLNNVQRMKRKMCGRKGDGYVRTFGPRPVEWAASECGPKWEGKNRTKIIRER